MCGKKRSGLSLPGITKENQGNFKITVFFLAEFRSRHLQNTNQEFWPPDLCFWFQQMLEIPENSIVSGMLVPKLNLLYVEWTKLHNEDTYDVNSSPKKM
jgi:hypothetical protein